MPKGELFINGQDAYLMWGISMDTSSLSTLMTPAGNKPLIENKSRLEHGKRVIVSNAKVEERNLNLTINLTARNESEFFSRYNLFCKELEKGTLNIKTKYQEDVLYKTIYISCQQFTQFVRKIAHFSLRLNEPNPNDRNM